VATRATPPRPPDLDVPIAKYGPNNSVDPSLPGFLQPLLDLACRLSGTNEILDQALLWEMYPDHDHYVSRYSGLARTLEGEGFLLHEDAQWLRMQAALRPIGANLCGLGFELAVLAPGMIWLRGRRRRGLVQAGP
jgi:hypothetical protein